MSAPIDPAFDTPFADYGQVGSFVAPVAVPSLGPLDGTLVNLPCINPDWLRLVLGCVDQLRNRSSWLGSYTDAQIVAILGAVEQLRIALQMANPCCDVAMRLQPDCVLQFSTDGGTTWTDVTGWATNFALCVQSAIIGAPPLLPPGSGPNQRACNIAAFLATDVIETAITQAINAYDHDLSLLALAGNIAALTFAFDLPWTAAAIYAVYDLYQFFTAGNIASLRAAAADSAFWSDVTCAIYSAIKTDGAVTPGNCASVIGGICGISYGDGVAVAAVCAYVTQLGCSGLMSAQIAGALNAGDCSGCGSFCYYFDFTLNNQGWAAEPGLSGTYLPAGALGPGWYQNVDGGHLALQFSRHLPGGAHVTSVQALIIDDNIQYGGAGNRSAYNQNPCNTTTLSEADSTFTGALPGATIVPFSPLTGNADCIKLYWNSQNVTGNSAVIKWVKIFGTGPNPFGADNCP